MKSDLDQLITSLGTEKKNLERQIKYYVAGNDYLLAHYHSEALSELNNRLRNLYLFKDPLYDERRNWERISLIEKRRPKYLKDKHVWNRMQEKWKENIVRKKAQLEEKEKNTDRFFTDGQEIDDALFKLYHKECPGFKLVFGDVYSEKTLIFSIRAKILLIEFTFAEFLDDPDFVINNRTPDPISGAGFSFETETKRWNFRYDMTNFKSAWPIKLFLAHFLFDKLWASDIYEPAKLIYL